MCFLYTRACHPVGQPQPRDDSTPASIWAAHTGVDGLLNKFLKDDMKSMGSGKWGVDLGGRRGRSWVNLIKMHCMEFSRS